MDSPHSQLLLSQPASVSFGAHAMEFTVLLSLLPAPIGLAAGFATGGDFVCAIVALGLGAVLAVPVVACLQSRLSYARRYEIWNDAVVVLGPTPLWHRLGQSRMHVPFTQIRSVKRMGRRSMGGWSDSEFGPGGWTSPGLEPAIWIDLNDSAKSPLILTPKDTTAFLDALNKALDAVRQP